MVFLSKCPVCRSTRIFAYGRKRLFRHEKPTDAVDAEDQFLLKRLKRESLIRKTYLCRSCTFLFQNPTYDEEELKCIYGFNSRENCTTKKNVGKEKKTLAHFDIAARNLKRRQRRYADLILGSNRKRVLDYGGATGINLVHSNLDNIDRYVYDFGKDTAPEKGVEAIKDFKGDDYFDMILYTHVIEHEPEPKATLKKMRKMISAGGYLYVEAPLEYMERIITRRPGAVWHINYFNRKTLIEIALRSGWEVEHLKIQNLPYGPLQMNCLVAVLKAGSLGTMEAHTFLYVRVFIDMLLCLIERFRRMLL